MICLVLFYAVIERKIRRISHTSKLLEVFFYALSFGKGVGRGEVEDE